MRYLYTTEPDKHCHEVEDGVYGRPVHNSEEPKLLKSGWFVSIQKARGAGDVRSKEKGQKEEEGQVVYDHEWSGDYDDSVSVNDREVWVAAYQKQFGRKPHHKMKTETIREKLENGMAQ